jgi:hypothetical protein
MLGEILELKSWQMPILQRRLPDLEFNQELVIDRTNELSQVIKGKVCFC